MSETKLVCMKWYCTYVLLQVKVVRLVGIMLIFYVKKDHAEFISDVEAESVGTGIMGRMVSVHSDLCLRFMLLPLCD